MWRIVQEGLTEVFDLGTEGEQRSGTIGLMPYRFAGRELHCARIREPANTSHHAEVMIERAVLLHQDDDVFHVAAVTCVSRRTLSVGATSA